MISEIKYISLLLLILLLGGCSEELPFAENNNDGTLSEIPVEIFVESVDGLSTRGLENQKHIFSIGDVIHVGATFTIPTINNNGDTVTSETKGYKAFKMNDSGKWVAVGTTKLYWPTKATQGVFRAYYIKSFQSSLERENFALNLKLSEIDDDGDPLYAITDTIKWGGKVNLVFRHLCTHLTFIHLEPDIADYFWLVRNDQGYNNVFSLRRTENNELIGEFNRIGDSSFDSLVYVQRRAEIEKENDIKTGSRVSFFLEPGNYSKVELRTINNYSYLRYESDNTSNLEANKPYVVDIQTSKGVTYIEDPEVWDDNDDSVYDVDPEEFLQHIVDGTDYLVGENEEDKVVILRSNASGTQLCRNVSFNFNGQYGNMEVPSGRNFDGGHHFIENVASNLFSSNHGTIQNLRLKNVRCPNVELWFVSENEENTRWGTLCAINEGIIHNIRFEDAEIKFGFGKGNTEPTVVYNIGSLVGSNTGTISDISYGRTIKLESSESGNNTIRATVNIGGLIGQSTGLVKNISPVDNSDANNGNTAENEIVVINHLQGDLATLYVGGVIGQAATNITDISIPKLTVDSSKAQGLVGNTGGLVGRLRATSGSPSLMLSCTAQGEIKGLPVSPYSNDYKAYSYTGGIAGYNYNFDVRDCRSVCNVSMATNISLDGDVIYATGGGFGRIIADNVISDNYIIGTTLNGPESNGTAYKGNFAGIVPANKSWDYFLGLGNIVNDLLNGKFIGASIDDVIPED